MKLFNKKQKNMSDAEAYLRSTDTVSRPTAILMSLVAFLVVFAVVFSLFLGGKWLYDRYSDNETTVKVDETTQNETSNNDNADDQDNSESNNGLGITVVDGSGERTARIIGSEFGEDDVPATSSAETQAAETTEVAGTNTEASALPRTGPASNLLLAFIAMIVATATHSLYSRNRN